MPLCVPLACALYPRLPTNPPVPLPPPCPRPSAVFDGYAGWDPEARFKIRVVCARPYHALFMHNMLIR